MLASAVTALRDLGVPAIAGAVVGALITHYAAKARGREEHERTLDLLIHQDERRAALAMLDACREIRNRVNAGDRVLYGQMHNEWQDRVSAPSRLIRSDELECRVRSFGSVIFFAFNAPEENVAYAVVQGALDVEGWLEHWLRHAEPPPAHLPAGEELRALVLKQGRLSFDALNELLAERA